MILNYNLMTKYVKTMDLNHPLPEYPRPTFVRSSYLNLNGKWNLAITKDENNFTFDREIIVPYVVESALSGVRYDLAKDEFLVYQKEFNLDKLFLEYDHIILHLDGVMQECDIFLNDEYLGHFLDGFRPIEIDIKEKAQVVNNLIVKAKNTPDYDLSVSKEAIKRGGIWYTKTSGIYKSVWLEAYNDNGVQKLTLKADMDGSIFGLVTSLSNRNEVTVMYKGETIYKGMFENEFVIQMPDFKLWSPEEPNIYDVIVDNGYEKVTSYVAFRKFEIVDKKFYLNAKEIFINGLLNQSYFSDGIYTPASYQVFKDDILAMKKLGFNAMRVHIKLEADIFYSYADRLGMLILQDIPNSGKYHFFKDSLLPTIMPWLPIKEYKASKRRKLNFLETAHTIIDHLEVHPSVIYYTIFNEGWGQFEADQMYKMLKEYAPEYAFDTTSGWFRKKKSDVLSIHNYFFKLRVPKSKRPVILSEYGGYSLKIKDHVFNDEKEMGYHKCKDIESYNKDLDQLFNTIDNLKKQGLAGAIYTQVSDVEDELNGLLTYDREVIKIKR